MNHLPAAPDRPEDLARHFRDFCLFEPGLNPGPVQRLYGFNFHRLAGLGCLETLELSGADWEKRLDTFLKSHSQRWIMGHLSYDFRLLAEPGLQSRHENQTGFSPASFYVPEMVLLEQSPSEWIMIRQSDGYVTGQVKWEPAGHPGTHCSIQLETIHRDFREFYTERYAAIHRHLRRGDIYEMNFCLPYSAIGTLDYPAALWRNLCTSNPNPFRALYRRDASWLLCNSPERFLCKKEGRLISQPIKGTRARCANPEDDKAALQALGASEKERAENVMIVDLVRNDLGRIAKTGTVRVDELFGLYTFPSVHQMISTISAEPDANTGFSQIMKALFPMGSMTGAPKYSAMQLIDGLEGFNRGLYSGSIGYIAPGGDFDFNVVIRSILYNETNHRFLFPAGSAVTVYSEAGAEFSECELKASRMLDALLEHAQANVRT